MVNILVMKAPEPPVVSLSIRYELLQLRTRERTEYCARSESVRAQYSVRFVQRALKQRCKAHYFLGSSLGCGTMITVSLYMGRLR